MLHTYEFWSVVGSQFLYGPEVLETVAARAAEMADKLNASGNLPCKIVYKVTAKTNAEISDVVREANYDKHCAGIITWCHTFSPSKMWINGFANLQKPYCHFATQYNREIPNEEIDMDFMNLNQAAHGDREHGFIAARLRMPRKVIAGYWQDEDVQKRLGDWMRAAVGVAVSRELKVMRFGDNMREVAVTEGDKVEVQAKLGWQVNTWPVGQLVDTMNAVTDAEIDALMDEYRAAYDFASEDTDFIETVRYQAREEIAMKKMLDTEGCKAFSNTFQDLYGMRQLPGIASQHLMAQGYGYGGEGDWKVAAMTAIIKAMAEGKTGGTGYNNRPDFECPVQPNGKEGLPKQVVLIKEGLESPYHDTIVKEHVSGAKTGQQPHGKAVEGDHDIVQRDTQKHGELGGTVIYSHRFTISDIVQSHIHIGVS